MNEPSKTPMPDPPPSLPKWKDSDYNDYARLFNDITFAPRPGGYRDPTQGGPWFSFSQRRLLTDYLWQLGYRVTERPQDGEVRNES
jgi:hypothetical protein